MKYDYVGVELIKIAAFLFAARFIAAALFMGPGLKNWDSSLFRAPYGYIGNELKIAASVAAITGVTLLVIAATRKKSA